MGQLKSSKSHALWISPQPSHFYLPSLPRLFIAGHHAVYWVGSITYQEAEHGDMVSQLVPHELNMPWILGQPVSSWNGLMCHGSAEEL